MDALPDGRCRLHEVLLARDGEDEHAGALILLVDGVPQVAKSGMRSEVRGESEIALCHGLHGVLDEGAEERISAVKARGLAESAIAVKRLEGGTEAKVARHVLLQLRPRTDKRDGAQVFEVDGAVLGTRGGAAADVGLPVVLQRAKSGEVVREFGAVSKREVMRVRGGAELVKQRLVLGQDARLFLVEQAVLDARREQKLEVEPRRLRNAKVGGDRLALDRGLDFAVLDVAAQRRVEAVGVSAAPCGGTAASVEEHHGAAVFAADVGEALLGAVDGPVGAEVAAVLGAVGEAEHDGLVSVALVEMRRVHRMRVELGHLGTRFVQILNRLKQRHQIHGQRPLPSAGLGHGVQDGDVIRTRAVAQNVSVAPGLAVVQLDFLHRAQALKHVLVALLVELPLKDAVEAEQEIQSFRFRKSPRIRTRPLPHPWRPKAT